MCPTEEESGHVDVTVVSKGLHVWTGGGKKRYLGPGKGLNGLKYRAVDPEHGTAWVELCILIQRTTIPSKRALLILIKLPHIIKSCVFALFHCVSKHILSSAG